MSVEDLTDLAEDELLARLTVLADDLDDLNGQRDDLYARRLELFLAGRRRTEPIKHRALGEAARVSDVAVINAVNAALKQGA